MGIYKETVNKVRVGGEIRTLRTTNYELDLAQFYVDLAAVGATVDRAMFEAALLEIDKSITQYSDLVLVPGIYKAGSVFAFNGMTKSFEEFSFSRGSSGSYTDANGFLQVQANGSMPRISYAFGTPFYLLEPASMNYALNSLNTFKKDVPVVTALPARSGETFTISAIINGNGSVGFDNATYGTGINGTYNVSQDTRISKTFTLPAKDGANNNLDGSRNFQINIWSGNLTMREVQIEPGRFQTSHIPTGAAIGVRAAETVIAKRQIISGTNVPLLNSAFVYNAVTLASLKERSANLLNLLTVTGLSTVALVAGRTYTFAAGAATTGAYMYMHIWPEGGSYGTDYNTDSYADTSGGLKVNTFIAKGNARVQLFIEVPASYVFTYKPTLVEGPTPLVIKYDTEIQAKTDRECLNTDGIRPGVSLQLRSLCLLTSNQLPA